MSENSRLYEILKKPIITEKSTALQEHNQYVFEVVLDANKIEIAKAVELAFPGRKVTKVRTINKPSTTRRFGKRMGTTKATKKAVVSIDGEPIELFTGV
ncbi:MAG: 50S ribosomal protein L23 [Cyanobacteriota bacterium]